MLDIGAHAERLAAVEKQEANEQVTLLDKRIARLEELVRAGELDGAEMEAAGVHWRPDATRSDISPTDAMQIAQYDRRREALLRVIRRKQKRTP